MSATKPNSTAAVPSGSRSPPIAIASSSSSSKEGTPNRSQPRAKKAARAKKKSPEKRLKRYRSSAPRAIRERIARARTQRLYLVQRTDVTGLDDSSVNGEGPHCAFTVLGSTGNVYIVTIGRIPCCNCPDHIKGNLCKHILFILLKVVGLPPDSPLVFQSALLTSELREIFSIMEARHLSLVGVVLANAAVRETYEKMTSPAKSKGEEEEIEGGAARKPLSEQPDCPICFDPMDDAGLTYCRAACGTNFHARCMTLWSNQAHKRKEEPSCPACRGPWMDEATGGISPQKKRSREAGGGGDEGYENLGALAGLPRERDTSTYHTEYMDWQGRYYKSRRRYR